MEKPQTSGHTSNPIKEEEIDLMEILYKYLAYWKVICFSVLLGFILAFGYNKISTPIYKIESSVLIKDEQSGNLGAEIFERAGFNMPKSNIENEMGVLRSHSLVYETLEALEYNVTYYEPGFLFNKELFRISPLFVEVDWSHPQLTGGQIGVEKIDDNKFRLNIEGEPFYLYAPADPYFKVEVENLELKEGEFEFGQVIQGGSFKFTVMDLGMEPGQKTIFKVTDTPTLTGEFRELLEITPINRLSTILGLKMELSNRKKGQEFLNKLMELYLARELDEKNRTASNTVTFIENQLTGIADSLSFIEDRLEKFRSRNNVFDLSQEGSLIFKRLEELEEEKSRLDLSLSYYRSMETYLQDEQLDDLIAPSFIGVQDPLLNSLVISLAELQSEKVRLTATFSDQTPTVREVSSKIRNTKRVLSENLRNAVKNAETALSEITARITIAEREANRLPSTERNLLSIQRQFSINENIYVYLLEKRAEAEITKASNYPSHSILDQARPNIKPVSPRKAINYLIGVFLGFILPVGFITVRDLFYTRIRDPHDVEKRLRIPLLGLIAFNPYKQNQVVLHRPKSVITESFRNIRANMSYISPVLDNFTIAISSSTSGEGKTFCSLNLASIYALGGKKTLLVGLDLRKPTLAQEFGFQNDIGVSTFLSKQAKLEQCIKKTEHENLSVLLSGPIPPNPAELMLQPKFVEMMDKIKSKYEVLILDCPPVGLVSETLEIFKYSDVNLMVLRHEYSEKSACEYINSLSEQSGVKKLYAILNGMKTKTKFSGYGKYGYGSGYGHSSNGNGYYEDEDASSFWENVRESVKKLREKTH
ncbi:GumC family protein [Pleomorphovibrio marinus]|uniref:GumC family protein n=1 Tax=Pleomorphovibrio marinus TaxID=2164132 RepID=UPI000E0B4D9A|nr:polysaccharide biosynthesis tyrosine autokinase [Pleomorphovibrio marinus]